MVLQRSCEHVAIVFIYEIFPFYLPFARLPVKCPVMLVLRTILSITNMRYLQDMYLVKVSWKAKNTKNGEVSH